MLTPEQVIQFIQNGYLIIKQAADKETIFNIREQSIKQLEQRIEPFELEATVQYPGAPKSIDEDGGQTIRRLLLAYERHDVFKEWAENSFITQSIKQLLGSKELFLTPNHHNTVMTKQPEYSSQTNWHRDTRYWHFNNKYLINSWLALGEESNSNGGLLVLPGSHRWDDGSFKIDEQQFLIKDHPANRSRLSLAKLVNLEAGDCLLFSAHCFHAAAENNARETKYSLVFTYHGEKTLAVENTRSSVLPAIKII